MLFVFSKNITLTSITLDGMHCVYVLSRHVSSGNLVYYNINSLSVNIFFKNYKETSVDHY